jgi:hypothetical protein
LKETEKSQSLEDRIRNLTEELDTLQSESDFKIENLDSQNKSL